MLYGFVETLLLPPANLVLIILVCLLFPARVFGRWRAQARVVARWVGGVSAAALYVLATPIAALFLINLLQNSSAAGGVGTPRAIVVLSAEANFAPEYGRATVGEMTLTRLRFAAALHRRTDLPVLATGGIAAGLGQSLGSMMARTLEQEFGVRPVWVEDRAQDTWENAKYSAPILAAHGVRDVYLVTSAFHMRRAMLAFRDAGINATPAPTGYFTGGLAQFGLLPQPRAVLISYYAFHEFVGILYYRIRARFGPSSPAVTWPSPRAERSRPLGLVERRACYTSERRRRAAV